MSKRGRHEIDDSAVLLKMAEGIVEGKFASAWAAAGAFCKGVEGQSPESTRRRLAGKYLKSREVFEGKARETTEEEEQEPGVYGFDRELYRNFARYLLTLKSTAERASLVAKFLKTVRERHDFAALVRRLLRRMGHSFTMEDQVFIHNLSWEMEEVRMNWEEMWRKLEEIDERHVSGQATDKSEDKA